MHLNPYRAGLDPRPGQYPWCSYRYYLDPRGAPKWLDWQTILAEISQREAAARIQYRRFVEAGVTSRITSPLSDTVDGWLLGSPQFVERYQDRGLAFRNSELAEESAELIADAARPIPNSEVPDPCALLSAVATAFDVPLETLLSRGRHRNRARLAAMWLCRERFHESLHQLGQRFGGLSPSTVSESLSEASRLLSSDNAFRTAVQAIERRC